MGSFHLRREGIVLVRQRHDAHALGWNKGHLSAETELMAMLIRFHRAGAARILRFQAIAACREGQQSTHCNGYYP